MLREKNPYLIGITDQMETAITDEGTTVCLLLGEDGSISSAVSEIQQHG